MTRSASETAEMPGKHVAAKSGLNRESQAQDGALILQHCGATQSAPGGN